MTITTLAAIAAIKEALAKGPTPGPWRSDSWWVKSAADLLGPAIALCYKANEFADSSFIAASIRGRDNGS